MNSIVNKNLGETPTPPDMSNVKQGNGSIEETMSIGSFSIAPMIVPEKGKTLKDGLLEESKDSGLNPS